MDDILAVKGVNKTICLPPGIPLPLLEDVNFTIRIGELVVLSGPPASGKTTLLGFLLGYEKEVEGEAVILGVEIGSTADQELTEFRNRNIGLCYADKAPIILNYTVADNIILRLQYLGKQANPQDLAAILEAFNLTVIADQLVWDGSFEELYKLMLAVAFCGPPPVVIIDEVFDYLGSNERYEILARTQILQKQWQITMIVVTQDIEIIKQADRTLYLRNCRLREVDMARLRAMIS